MQDIFVHTIWNLICNFLPSTFWLQCSPFQGSAEIREEWRRLRERGCALPVSKTQNSGKGRTLILRRRTGMARPHLCQDLHLPISQLAGRGNSEVLLDGPQVKGNTRFSCEHYLWDVFRYIYKVELDCLALKPQQFLSCFRYELLPEETQPYISTSIDRKWD